MAKSFRTLALIDRLARLHAAEAWAHDLNPSQTAALAYLAQANRFSRAPSHLADYLGSTRGTVSQTLKALTRKGLVAEHRSATDRRTLRYDLTPAGQAATAKPRELEDILQSLPDARADLLNNALADLLRTLLSARGERSFGLCHTCTHHENRGEGGYCRLLKVALQPPETQQICHEHSAWSGLHSI